MENVFNWFTATVIFFPFIFFYERLFPIFAPENNQRSFLPGVKPKTPCSSMFIIYLADRLVELLQLFADLAEKVQG